MPSPEHPRADRRPPRRRRAPRHRRGSAGRGREASAVAGRHHAERTLAAPCRCGRRSHRRRGPGSPSDARRSTWCGATIPSLVRDAVRRLVDELVGDGDRDADGRRARRRGLRARRRWPTPPRRRRSSPTAGSSSAATCTSSRPTSWPRSSPTSPTRCPRPRWCWCGRAAPCRRRCSTRSSRPAASQVDTSPGRTPSDQRAWLAERVAESGVHLDRAAADAGRRARSARTSAGSSGVLATLAATYGAGAKLGADDVEPYLGEAGGVAPWELTDAIDRGDIPTRRRPAAPHVDSGERHALVVLATLHSHVQRMLALDGAGARNEKDAAAVLGMKGSTFPAKKALDQGRRLGGDKVAQAVAAARRRPTVDLRGAKDVARRAGARGAGRPPGVPRPAVARLHGRAATRSADAGGVEPLGQAALAAGGGVLVDDALGGGLVDALLGQPGGGVGVLGAGLARRRRRSSPGSSAPSGRPCCARGGSRSACCA